MAGDTVPPTPDFVLAVPFGALIAVVGILSAVAERDRTGHGRFVDAGIVDAATWVIGEAVARVAEGQAAGWGQQASRRAYRTADGRLITLAAAEPRTWAALCDALDRPDLADRLFTPPDGQEALAAELAALFAARPAADWLSRLQDAGAMVGPVATVEELLTADHVEAHGSIVELDDGTGTRVLRTPVHLRDADGTEAVFAPRPATSTGRAHRRRAGGRGVQRRRDRRPPPRRRGLTTGAPMTFEIDLSGHRALVTGAGQGVGEGIAATLAAAGAEVLVNDLVLERAERVVSVIEDAGGVARPAVFDVTDYDAVVAAVGDGGPIDILVNNAGNAGRAATHGHGGSRHPRADRTGRLGRLHAGQPVRRDVRGARRPSGDDRRAVGTGRDRDL